MRNRRSPRSGVADSGGGMAAAMVLGSVIWCPCVGDMVHVANGLYLCSYLVRMTVNAVQIGILLRERRPRQLAGPERELYEQVFSELTPGEFRRLVKLGQWRKIDPGSTIVHRDTVVHDMQVLWQGALEVRTAGGVIARLEPGQFVGEMSFISGEKATADVVATEPSRVLAWSQESLNELLEKKPGLAFKIRGILGRDVVAKLRAHGQSTG
ncbi:MAG: cyclic nucleotide-binding domain-containing protein [Planctomycetia bacterium]|nr:cyclic nucleotide-binding domain-containing protein [Planctomycetia bacterium]